MCQDRTVTPGYVRVSAEINEKKSKESYAGISWRANKCGKRRKRSLDMSLCSWLGVGRSFHIWEQNNGNRKCAKSMWKLDKLWLLMMIDCEIRCVMNMQGYAKQCKHKAEGWKQQSHLTLINRGFQCLSHAVSRHCCLAETCLLSPFICLYVSPFHSQVTFWQCRSCGSVCDRNIKSPKWHREFLFINSPKMPKYDIFE